MLLQVPELDEQELRVVEMVEDLRRQLRLQLVEPRRWSGTLRRLSFARAIQGSNSIEGFTAALDDVAAAAAGDEPLDASAETTLALRGYREAMTYVLQLAGEEDFVYSERLLKSLHFMMSSYDLQSRPGLWRAGDIFVHNEESHEIVYEGPNAEGVPALMREVVDDLNAPEDGTPGLVRAGMAHLNLVMVHPFRDGNGRMGRCLQTLVLARDGVLAPQFCSIEEYLGRNTEAYYDVLAEVGTGAWNPQNDARPWVRFLLTAHFRQGRTLLDRVRESEQLWFALDRVAQRERMQDRTIDAMFEAAIGLRVRRASYLSMLSGEISEQAAGRDLRLLAERGLLVAHGEKRGRHYTGSPEITAIWRAIRAKRERQIDPFDESARVRP